MKLKTGPGNQFGRYASFDNIDSSHDGRARAAIENLELFVLVLGRHEGEQEEKGEIENEEEEGVRKEQKQEEGEDGGQDKEGEENEYNGNGDYRSGPYYMALIVVSAATAPADGLRMRRLGWVFVDPVISEGRNVREDTSEFQTVVLV
jgi:hypothetical protein